MVLASFYLKKLPITSAIDGARGEKKGDAQIYNTKKLYHSEQKTDREKKKI